jgi:hypothetical protein
MDVDSSSAGYEGETVMGLFRKMTSVSTLGAVDFRSDKERTARKSAKGARAAKRTAAEARQQTALLREQNRLLAAQNGRPAEQAASVEERLRELDRLLKAGVISAQEHSTRRAEVIRGI